MFISFSILLVYSSLLCIDFIVSARLILLALLISKKVKLLLAKTSSSCEDKANDDDPDETPFDVIETTDVMVDPKSTTCLSSSQV